MSCLPVRSHPATYVLFLQGVDGTVPSVGVGIMQDCQTVFVLGLATSNNKPNLQTPKSLSVLIPHQCEGRGSRLRNPCCWYWLKLWYCKLHLLVICWVFFLKSTIVWNILSFQKYTMSNCLKLLANFNLFLSYSCLPFIYLIYQFSKDLFDKLTFSKPFVEVLVDLLSNLWTFLA